MLNLDKKTAKTVAALLKATIESRNAFPVLGTVRVTHKLGVTTLTATDLEQAIQVKINRTASDCDYLTDGKFLTKALALPAWDEFATPQEVDSPVSDFPDTSELDNSTYTEPYHMGAARLANVCKAFKPFMSKEAMRHYLRGVFFDVENRAFVATDGHQLLKIAMPESVADAPRPDVGYIVPTKMINALAVLGAGAPKGSDVQVEHNEWHTKVTADVDAYRGVTVTLTSKNVVGSFPDYSRIIPSRSKSNTASFNVEHKKLKTIGKAAAINALDRSSRCKVSITPDGATSFIADGGVALDTADGGTTRGEPFEVAFNGKYLGNLADAAKLLGYERLGFEMGDPAAKIVFDDDAGTDLAVLMPLRP